MTYTIVVSVPERRLLGVATASRSLAVGAGVPAIRPGVGAVASQAYTNRALRKYALDALAGGRGPDEIVRAIGDVDSAPAYRQLAVVGADGRAAAHTGSACTAYADSVIDGHVVVVGNLLAGPEVLSAMLDGYAAAEPPTTQEALAHRLLAALRAGERAGGDVRGRQAAALLVAEDRGERQGSPADNIDLRADDHRDPLAELERLLGLHLGG